MNILVSSCLLGYCVRYDGGHNKIDSLESILSSHTLIAFCPEIEGGLSTPRAASEIVNNQVITQGQEDVTFAFELGAKKALEVCLEHNISIAVLKSKSPSCGNEMIYDGTFTRNLISGQGCTAKLLSQYGIRVFNENQLLSLAELLK